MKTHNAVYLKRCSKDDLIRIIQDLEHEVYKLEQTIKDF